MKIDRKNNNYFSSKIMQIIIFAVISYLTTYVLNNFSHKYNEYGGTILKKEMQLNDSLLDKQLFKQKERNTCGIAALTYILNRYGYKTYELEMTIKTVLKPEGMSIKELLGLVNKMGYRAEGRMFNYSALITAHKPLIILIHNNHYVVVLKTVENEIIYFDPNIGEYVRIYKKELLNIWSGMTIQIFPHSLEYYAK